MFKVCLIVGLFIVLPNAGLCQLSPSFESILKTALSDSVVAAEGQMFNNKWKRAYVFTNKVFEKQVSEYDSLSKASRDFHTLDSALTTKLFATNHGLVFLFRRAALLSNYEVERVIVIDKYKKTNSGARFVFHTTNCHSEIGYKPTTAFKKFAFELVLDDNTWVVRHVKISMTKFKPIVD